MSADSRVSSISLMTRPTVFASAVARIVRSKVQDLEIDDQAARSGLQRFFLPSPQSFIKLYLQLHAQHAPSYKDGLGSLLRGILRRRTVSSWRRQKK